MRTIKMLFILSVAACASGAPLSQPGSVDVASIRNEIQHVDARPIVAMGHVSNSTAVVFTDDGTRREEVWQRSDRGWKLRESKEVAR